MFCTDLEIPAYGEYTGVHMNAHNSSKSLERAEATVLRKAMDYSHG